MPQSEAQKLPESGRSASVFGRTFAKNVYFRVQQNFRGRLKITVVTLANWVLVR